MPLFSKSKNFKILNKDRLVFGGCLLIFILLSAGMMIFTANLMTASGDSEGRTTLVSNVLKDIHTGIHAYRLAQLENVLSSDHEDKSKYEKRMESVLRQITGNQKKLKNLISTHQKQNTYEKFNSEWEVYLYASKQMITLFQKSPKQPAIESLTINTRELFEKSTQTLDMLMEKNLQKDIPIVDLLAKWFRNNWLALSLIYVIGISTLLILMFNFYYKIKQHTEI